MKYTTAIRILLALAALSFVGMLRAQERHIDFTQVLSGVDGKPLQSPDAKNTKGLTLGEAAMAALVAPLEQDKGMAEGKGFAEGSRLMREQLAAQFEAQRSGMFSGYEICDLIREALPPARPD